VLQRSPMKRSAASLKRSAITASPKSLARTGATNSTFTKPTSFPRKAIATGKGNSDGRAPIAASGFKEKVYSTLGRKQKREPGTDAKPTKLAPASPAETKPRAQLRTRAKTTPKAERDHMGRVAELGCVLCSHLRLGATPAIVHHLRTGQGKMRATNWLTLPLCPTHHQHSGYGVHDMGRRQFFEMYSISEIGLLQSVFLQLRVNANDPKFALPPDALTADKNDEPDDEYHDVGGV
jgi:hypothetical protein